MAKSHGAKPATPEIDIHGMGRPDIERHVRRFINMAAAEGAHAVRVVHGSGHAAQRQALDSILDALDPVESYHLVGAHGFGREATLVVLKRG